MKRKRKHHERNYSLNRERCWIPSLLLAPHSLLPFLLISCSPGSADTSTSEPSGKAIYQQYCTDCHGPDGRKGVAGAKDLAVTELGMEERKRIISRGRGNMIPYENILSEAEITAVAGYLDTLHKSPP